MLYCIGWEEVNSAYVVFFKPFNKNTTKTIHIDTVTTKDQRKCLTTRVKEMSDQFRTKVLKGDFIREYKHLTKNKALEFRRNTRQCLETEDRQIHIRNKA